MSWDQVVLLKTMQAANRKKATSPILTTRPEPVRVNERIVHIWNEIQSELKSLGREFGANNDAEMAIDTQLTIKNLSESHAEPPSPKRNMSNSPDQKKQKGAEEISLMKNFVFVIDEASALLKNNRAMPLKTGLPK